MTSRCLILIGAFLLIARCVWAELPPAQKQRVSDSSLHSSAAQEAREFGRPLYRVFTRRDKGIVNRIISATQDSRGLMIFGSVNCVLEYDGQQWTSVPIPNGGWITALTKDRSGTVWVGATGEVGTLVYDGTAYHYSSYTHFLPESEQHFGIVMDAAIHDEDVYFLCEKSLLRWANHHLSVIPLPYEPGVSWAFSSYSGRLFVHANHKPFTEVVGDRLVPVMDDPLLREATVAKAIQVANDKTLLVTREKGIFALSASDPANGSSEKPSVSLAKQDSSAVASDSAKAPSDTSAKAEHVVPFKTDADDLLKQGYVVQSVQINHNLFVLAVLGRGLVFLDAAGHVKQTFFEEDGLPTGALDDLYLDRTGGLWVIGESSLTRINPDRSITVFDHENGLPKSYVACTVRFGGFLYALTGNGLYRLEPRDGGEGPSQFSKVAGVTDFLHDALPASPYGLLLPGEKGVYLFDGNRLQLVANSLPNHAIVRSQKSPDRFFLAGEDGVRILRFAVDHWVVETLPGFDHDAKSLAETANGDLFIATPADGCFLVKLGPRPEAPFDGARVESLVGAPRPSANGMFHVQAWKDQILFSSDRNLFLFQPTDRSFHQPDFLPKQLLGREIHVMQAGASKPDHLWLETVIGETGSVQVLEIGCLDADGTYHPLPQAISSFVGSVSSYNEEPSPRGPTLWISGEYGVARVDFTQTPEAEPNLNIYLREGMTASGEPLHLPQTNSALELPFEKRDIWLRFATDNYDGPDEVRYRTKLDGL
ncbi:MAG: hypothetical protein JO331_07160, partial [Verrucomicrobia bacterium]|nr:hypothetical protein [Verrucomicrobiota bacterium]